MKANATKKSARPPVNTKHATTAPRRNSSWPLTYKEAVGKTVEAIEYSEEIDEGNAELEIRFADNTTLSFTLDARPRLRAQYRKWGNGDARILHDYPLKTRF